MGHRVFGVVDLRPVGTQAESCERGEKPNGKRRARGEQKGRKGKGEGGGKESGVLEEYKPHWAVRYNRVGGGEREGDGEEEEFPRAKLRE